MLAEKLGLLKRTCSDKYLLLPAIFIFLWQVHSLFDTAYACPSCILHAGQQPDVGTACRSRHQWIRRCSTLA